MDHAIKDCENSCRDKQIVICDVLVAAYGDFIYFEKVESAVAIWCVGDDAVGSNRDSNYRCCCGFCNKKIFSNELVSENRKQNAGKDSLTSR